jgi:CubicO group peptidase (beta-lactamase class C family)
MKRILQWLTAAGLVALAAPQIGCSGESPTTPGRDELREELERRLTAAAAAGFSGAVLITVDGAKVLASGYGLADRDNDIPNVVDTAYDFGSVMKDLTAAAVFKLEGEGKLAVTDSLATIFDDVPADKAEITILQILQHRAGFDVYHDTEGDFEPMTRLEAHQWIFAQQLLFEPGSEEEYSNSGYTLLADVVQTVSGREFTDYVRDELFAPGGMQQSGFFGDPIWEQVDTAIGYDASTFGENDPAGWPYTWSLVGNGGLVTTVSDLERWLITLWKGEVLGPAAFESYEAHYLAGNAADFEGRTVYVFAGAGDYGLGGFAVDCPEANTRVILGTNTYEVFDIEGFGIELARLVLSAEEGALSPAE